MSVSGDSSNGSPRTYEPVVSHDFTRASYHSGMGPIKDHTVTQTKETRSSESSGASLKSPRTARFAEATTIYSPVERSGPNPFAGPDKVSQGVADTGFGYVAVNTPARPTDDSMPPMSPWRADLKVPKSAMSLNPLSPTFREEYYLEKGEKHAEKENARDVRIKLRVRIAKIFLRFVNFGCSLIVLAMLGLTLHTFMATKDLADRNTATVWAPNTNPWAQWLLLGLACFSLLACMVVFWGYFKGGHHRAEKLTIYYTTISVVYFTFSFIMWLVCAAIYEHSKSSGNTKDLWGWACAKNTREQVYSDAVDYALLCRLQDWGLVCAVIEVVIELLVILIYVVVFYRMWSKRRLMKSMNKRDQARSDMYLAQLHCQAAPNTPGFPGFSSYPPKSPFTGAQGIDLEKGEGGPPPQIATAAPTQYAAPLSPTRPTPSFQLQAPPIRVQQPTPRAAQEEFAPPPHASHAQTPSPPPQPQGHVSAAPGEQSFGSVPIPGAY